MPDVFHIDSYTADLARRCGNQEHKLQHLLAALSNLVFALRHAEGMLPAPQWIATLTASGGTLRPTVGGFDPRLADATKGKRLMRQWEAYTGSHPPARALEQEVIRFAEQAQADVATAPLLLGKRLAREIVGTAETGQVFVPVRDWRAAQVDRTAIRLGLLRYQLTPT